MNFKTHVLVIVLSVAMMFNQSLGSTEKLWHQISSDSIHKMEVAKYLNFLKSQAVGRVSVTGLVNKKGAYEDIVYLVGELGSNTPCMSVARNTSSFISSGRSQLDREIKFLLLGYKEANYPPRLNSLRVADSELDEALIWANKIINKRK